MLIPKSCNRCCINCKGANTHDKMFNCSSFVYPNSKFPLIELALSHPESLYKVLIEYDQRVQDYC